MGKQILSIEKLRNAICYIQLNIDINNNTVTDYLDGCVIGLNAALKILKKGAGEKRGPEAKKED